MLYRIAELYLKISFCDSIINGTNLIPSFLPFRVDEKEMEGNVFLELTVDDTLKPRRENRERIGKFDTGNGDTVVDRFPDGGYQFIIKDIFGNECCLLQAENGFCKCKCALNGDFQMRQFCLNNALMLAFAFAGSGCDTLLMHASLVRNNGFGYAFIAKSGTGKSTQVSNWLKYIPDCDLMNDDNPVVRIIDGEAFVYGSPWSGKTPCYRNVRAKLGAITRISRDNKNWIEELKPIEAFASLLPSCSSMKWDKTIYNALCNIVTKIIETTHIYTLHCLPDKESAIICHKAIARN